MDNYEIFISFKNTDVDGKLTHDSEMAQELYDELVKRGCKVFYSDILNGNTQKNVLLYRWYEYYRLA